METALSVPEPAVPAPGGQNDSAFLELWLNTKSSSHSRRAYRFEIERFFAWLPRLRLLYASGIRVSELANLKWCDTMEGAARHASGEGREAAGQISVFGKDGNKTRTILLKPRTWQQLLGLRGGAGATDPVFRSGKGGHLDVSQLRRIVYRACERAGLEQKASPHWMRQAHASHALDRGAPTHLVQTTLGHSSVSTTGRYLHAKPSDSSSFYLPD